MLEAVLKNGEILRKIIVAIGDLVQDANFDCNEYGLSLQAMDSSHVSLVSMILKREGFEPWRCDHQSTLGIHLDNLVKILKCMGSKDEVGITYKEGADECDFVFKNPAEDKVSNFSLKLMEIDSEHLGIPETDYKTTVRMSAAEFQRICRDLAVIGDTLTIQVAKDNISFAVNGDLGKGEMSLRAGTSGSDEAVSTIIDCAEPVTQTFAMRYLNFFTKATNLSRTVDLSMSPEVPLMVEYTIDEIGYVRYYLAPKIEEE
jgi:proliferating cell nuclear antigen